MQQPNDPDQFAIGVGPASWEADQIMEEQEAFPSLKMHRKQPLNLRLLKQ